MEGATLISGGAQPLQLSCPPLSSLLKPSDPVTLLQPELQGTFCLLLIRLGNLSNLSSLHFVLCGSSRACVGVFFKLQRYGK